MVFLGIMILIVVIALFFMYWGCRHEVGLFVNCGQCEFQVTARFHTAIERNNVIAELEHEHRGHKPVTVQTWEIYR